MSNNEPPHETDTPHKTSNDEAGKGASPAKARHRTPLWLRITTFGLTAALLAASLLVFVTLPRLQKDMEAAPANSLALTVLDSDGQEIGSRGGTMAPVVPIAELPPYLVKAFVATEDRRFYSHWGIDWRGIARAAWYNMRAGSVVEGGSTITQQLAKNVYLDSDRTFWRKAQEALIAVWLEANYSKDEILTAYLNRIYMGAGNYGIDAAAHYYFGKSARDVSLSEAAILAGLPKAPSRFAPTNDLALARARANVVLARMVSNGDLTPAEMADASAHPATVAPRDARDGQQYFVDWVAYEVRQLLPDATGRLTIKTTLDRKRQRAAEAAVASALKDGEKRNVSQGSALVLSQNGAILAMVGGKSYLESQFNRATQAERQPGSAFKPVIYLTAMEKGFTPSDTMDDSPITLGEWKPQNYESGSYSGIVTLTTALAKSINTVAVKLADKVGVQNITDMAARMGITSPIQANLSIALGSSEVTLMELTSAYSIFNNDGKRAVPFGIVEIISMDGETLYENRPAAYKVTEPRYAQEMNFMMHQVMTTGTGVRAALSDRTTAGKTGTSQDYRDAWFIGYTGNEIAGFWFGNDDNHPTGRASGGNFAAPAWHNYMVVAQKGVPPVVLAGADADVETTAPEPRATAAAPIRSFLGQLADLFSAAPRLDTHDDGNLSSGRSNGRNGLQTGGGRPH
ncbi:MAG: transglycosylase domain-containing protein [Parvibaculaceae bacterium]